MNQTVHFLQHSRHSFTITNTPTCQNIKQREAICLNIEAFNTPAAEKTCLQKYKRHPRSWNTHRNITQTLVWRQLAGAVVVSGVVALTLSPMMCSKVFKTSRHGWFEQTVENSFSWLSRMYGTILHRALNFSSVIVVFGLAVLVCIYLLFTMAQNELAPTEDQSILYVSGRGPETATVEYTRHYAHKIIEV